MKKRKSIFFKTVTMHKLFLLLLMLVGTLILVGCGDSSSGIEKEAKDKMKEGISYYSDEFIDKLPELSGEENAEKVTQELESAIDKSKNYVDLYMKYMDNEELSEDYREAAMNLKTAFYGIQTTALEPMLEIMKTNTGEAPDYPTLVLDAKEMYVDKAEELLK